LGWSPLSVHGHRLFQSIDRNFHTVVLNRLMTACLPIEISCLHSLVFWKTEIAFHHSIKIGKTVIFSMGYPKTFP